MSEPDACANCSNNLEIAIIDRGEEVIEIYACLNCGKINQVIGDTQ